MTKNLLFQDIAVEEEQIISGGKYSFRNPRINIDVDVDFNLNFDIENLNAKSGDQIARNGGTVTGSSGGVSVGNI